MTINNENKSVKKPHLRINEDDVVLSPYVIRLSKQSPDIPAAPKLDALAKQLTDGVDAHFDEEVNNDLSLTFDDLVSQFQDQELCNQAPTAIADRATAIMREDFHHPPHIVVEARDKLHVDTEILTGLPEATPHILHILAQYEDPVIELATLVDAEQDTIESRKTIGSLFQLPDFSFSFPVLASVRMRAVAVFALLAFIVVTPLQALQAVAQSQDLRAEATDAGKRAIDNFMRANAALEQENFSIASQDFSRASAEFSGIEDRMRNMNVLAAGIVNIIPKTDRTYDTVKGLVTAGSSLTKAASELTEAAEAISDQESTDLITKLTIMSLYLEAAAPEIQAASDAIVDIDLSIIPEDYQETATELQRTIPRLADSVQEFLVYTDALSYILGDEQKMRYILAFQNNTELRATGGFIGSYAQIDMLRGEIEQIDIPGGGTYDVQGQLQTFVEAPEPLQLLNARWEFHDANWSPDFPTSAQKLIEFYESAGGPTVDGVIALNADIIPEILEITGPIDMPEYGRTIDAENFLFETQKIVEFEYADFDEERTREEDAPKQFIGDLAPLLLEKMQDADMQDLIAFADILARNLSQKDIQVYFEDNAIQAHMQDLGWTGQVKHSSGDYLYVVSSNLGGGKTDSIISQHVDLDIDIQDDGRIINTVTLTKEHHGIPNALFEGVNNVDYLRLYVPRGSTLLEADGFEIPADELFETSDIPLAQDQDLLLNMTNVSQDPISQTDIWDEAGKTVFGNWIQTAPGEVETVRFVYELPFTFDLGTDNPNLLEIAKSHLGFKQLENYTLFMQKQSGVERDISVNLHLPETSEIIWSSQESFLDGTLEQRQSTDMYARTLIENHID